VIDILFVGEGARDAAVVPPIVERVFDAPINPSTIEWPRLADEDQHSDRRFDRKLELAIRLALRQQRSGVVAVLDVDKSRKKERLRQLQKGRDNARAKMPPIPTAVGTAIPHGEAWILDDSHAVRQTLNLPNDVQIPAISKVKNPKAALEELARKSQRNDVPYAVLLGEIAKRIDPRRCVHAKDTGFAEFNKDLKWEYRSLLKTPRTEAPNSE